MMPPIMDKIERECINNTSQCVSIVTISGGFCDLLSSRAIEPQCH